MRTSPLEGGLTESIVSEIISYVRIAELHGASLSLSEAVNLMSSEITEEELASAWASSSELASEYPLRSGRIVSKQALTAEELGGVEAKMEAGARRVDANMRLARAVWNIFSRDGLKLFSMSGGNSYRFARPGDDIDLFCVTRTNGLWRFMLKQLLVVRFYGTFREDLPRLCFSYVLDEGKAWREFRRPRDKLFARDALNLKVIEGGGFLDSLVNEARWMESLYPKAYRVPVVAPEHPPKREESSQKDRILNLLLYRTVGSFIRVKSFLDNFRNRRAGRFQLVNRLSMGEGHVLYESQKYQTLRSTYEYGVRMGTKPLVTGLWRNHRPS